MSKILKRKFKEYRKEFKKELFQACLKDVSLPMLIIETYVAKKHREHISKMWWMMSKHADCYKEYCETLGGKHLTGRDDIFRTLYFTYPETRDRFIRKIPEKYAMGDALSVAYAYLKNKKKDKKC